MVFDLIVSIEELVNYFSLNLRNSPKREVDFFSFFAKTGDSTN